MAQEDQAGKRVNLAHVDSYCKTTNKNVGCFEMRYEDFPSLETGLGMYTETTTEQLGVSKRSRTMPKVYTPNNSENRVYCFCANENYDWYIMCSIQMKGCLVYYHPKCVNLKWMKDPEDAATYSNCADKKSYACPICSFKKGDERRRGIKEEVREDTNVEPVETEELDKCVGRKEGGIVHSHKIKNTRKNTTMNMNMQIKKIMPLIMIIIIIMLLLMIIIITMMITMVLLLMMIITMKMMMLLVLMMSMIIMIIVIMKQT